MTGRGPVSSMGRARATVCRWAIVAAGLVLLSCGGGEGGLTNPRAESVASVRVDPATTTVGIGGTTQLTALLADGNGTALTDRLVTWESSDAAIATVDAEGRVTGVAPGTVTVTATSEGRRGSASVTVTSGEGELRVSVETLAGGDPDGYRLLLDGVDVGEISDGDELSLGTLPAGGYDVTLAGISERCVALDASRSVPSPTDFTVEATVVGEAERTVTFRITCAVDLASGETRDVALPVGDVALYAVDVPPTATRLEVELGGPNGDADLYVRAGGVPFLVTAGVDCFSEGLDTNESCTIESPVPSTWFVMVVAFSAFTEAELAATVTTSTGAVSTVELSPADAVILVEDSVTLSAVLRDSLGAEVTGFPVSWRSSNEAVASIDAAGRVAGLDVGSVEITAVADGVEASVPLHVNVPSDASGFGITLEYLTPVGAADRAIFEAAAAQWEEIITADIDDIDAAVIPKDPAFACGGEFNEGIVDDVHIFVRLEEIDGPFQILGSAGPCLIRSSTDLPINGRMRFDIADVQRLRNEGNLASVIVHEMGHVLGIGTLWDNAGLRSSDAQCRAGADPIFTGARARVAFDSVGGTGYTGPKVPLSNAGSLGDGSTCSHWREGVLGPELMTTTLNLGVANPLSLVTVESLADLGYSVDADVAEDYTLPGSSLAQPGSAPGAKLDFGDDALRPIAAIGPDGRVVRRFDGGRR